MIDLSGHYSTVVHHKNGSTKITLLGYPGPEDWMEVKRRALVTIGKKPVSPPTRQWIRRMLCARHSPIRYALYSFEFEDIPSNTSTHFARHVHAQSYVGSLRTDRIGPEVLESLREEFGDMIDSDHAPRLTPVGMILDVNAEELMVMMNKRLCKQASAVTRSVAMGMKNLVKMVTPEMDDFMVPACATNGLLCHEFNGCGTFPHYLDAFGDESNEVHV